MPSDPPASPSPSSDDAKATIQRFFDNAVLSPGYSGWDTPLLRSVTILSASPPTRTTPARATFSLPITPSMLNRHRTLHGGCTSTLFDVLTTAVIPLIARPAEGFWTRSGVSRTLNVSFLRPVAAGQIVRIECEVVSVGRRMVALRGTMRDENGRVLATAEHGKVSIDDEQSAPKARL